MRALSADIVLQSNPLGTPYTDSSFQDLALTLLHELGHVFDIVSSLGGSAIRLDGNPDGSPNMTIEAQNAAALRNCDTTQR